jgi:quercetin dioxygenase-like cupin family protein
MKTIKTIVVLVILFTGVASSQQNLFAQEINPIIMNIKQLHTEEKAVQTQLLFTASDGKVVSMQIAKDEQLKEHVSKLPALFVCVMGDAVYEDENGLSVTLKTGDYVFIEKDVKHKVSAKEDSNFLLIR